MRVLVTGGAGFVGTHAIRALVARGYEVVVLDDFSTGHEENVAGIELEVVEGSILAPDTLDDAVHGADAVLHLAARPSVARSVADPLASHEVNATGTLHVLEAARRAGGVHVVVASSSSVYGANPTLPKREDLVPQPMSPYAAGKLAAEAAALAHQHVYGLPVMVFRLFNVFGPRQPAGHAYAAVIPAFVDAALSGRPLVVHGDGRQSRDFTFVGTVAEVLADAVGRRATCSEPVNLAFGTRTDILTLAHLVAGEVGGALTVEHAPPRPGDVRHSTADGTRLRALFPDVAPVALPDALRETVAWHRGERARR